MFLTDFVTAIIRLFSGAMALAIAFVITFLVAVVVIKLCGSIDINVEHTYEGDDKYIDNRK